MNAAPDILTRIAGDRRRRIEEMRVRVPAYVLRERLGEIVPAGRLERPLRRGGRDAALKLVCEIKRASPSKGVLRADVDPAGLARIYTAAGASAISVVTEPDHFQGDLGWIDAVRAATTLPILLKD